MSEHKQNNKRKTTSTCLNYIEKEKKMQKIFINK